MLDSSSVYLLDARASRVVKLLEVKETEVVTSLTVGTDYKYAYASGLIPI